MTDIKAIIKSTDVKFLWDAISDPDYLVRGAAAQSIIDADLLKRIEAEDDVGVKVELALKIVYPEHIELLAENQCPQVRLVAEQKTERRP